MNRLVQTVTSEEDMDQLLSVLENPIRRRILERLSQETHYPLQLSKELGVSQQAIMKHLKVMEDKGIVESFEEPSTSGGPTRKCYRITRRATVRIDMTPSSFRAKMSELSPEDEPSPDYSKLVDDYNYIPAEEKQQRLRALSRMVNEIDREMGEMELRRRRLMSFRDRLIADANHIIAEINDDYMKRQVLYVLVGGRATTIDEISDKLDIRLKVLQEMMKDMEDYMYLVETK